MIKKSRISHSVSRSYISSQRPTQAKGRDRRSGTEAAKTTLTCLGNVTKKPLIHAIQRSDKETKCVFNKKGTAKSHAHD